jgi:hypothetical protein
VLPKEKGFELTIGGFKIKEILNCWNLWPLIKMGSNLARM